MSTLLPKPNRTGVLTCNCCRFCHADITAETALTIVRQMHSCCPPSEIYRPVRKSCVLFAC